MPAALGSLMHVLVGAFGTTFDQLADHSDLPAAAGHTM